MNLLNVAHSLIPFASHTGGVIRIDEGSDGSCSLSIVLPGAAQAAASVILTPEQRANLVTLLQPPGAA